MFNFLPATMLLALVVPIKSLQSLDTASAPISGMKSSNSQKNSQLQIPYQEFSDVTEPEELESEQSVPSSTMEPPKKYPSPGDYIRGTLSDLFRQAVNSPTDLGIVIAKEVNELYHKITNTRFEIKPKSKPAASVTNGNSETGNDETQSGKPGIPNKIRSTYDLIQVVLG